MYLKFILIPYSRTLSDLSICIINVFSKKSLSRISVLSTMRKRYHFKETVRTMRKTFIPEDKFNIIKRRKYGENDYYFDIHSNYITALIIFRYAEPSDSIHGHERQR